MVDELVRVWRDDGKVQGPLSLGVRVVLLAGQQMVACKEDADGLRWAAGPLHMLLAMVEVHPLGATT
jgi:hypothetical protein